MQDKVLALYDFASKQEYIYRTSRIKEISGASMLLAGFYIKFPAVLENGGLRLKYEIESEFRLETFGSGGFDGEVLYDGGGNLMVLWRSKETYQKANNLISVYLLTNAPGLTMIVSCVPFTGVFDNKEENGETVIGDRTKLYEANAARKNRFPSFDMPSVLPFTQIDPDTFLPVTYKRGKNASNSVYPAKECSLSADRFAKASAYGAAASRPS